MNEPTFTIYHPNAKGTGSALAMAVQPVKIERDGQRIGGAVNCLMVPQSGIGPATFDWGNGICVQLGFEDICKMLQVFRGEEESINDGRGLIHVLGNIKLVQMRHMLEPICGYELVFVSRVRDEQDKTIKIVLMPHEALGICEALAGVMSKICFGI